ncbi:MAG: C2H2-type zinc finger protein [Thermoplasmata archaeon]
MPYVEYDEVEAICSDCGRMFRSEDDLAAHRAESHAGLEDPSTSSAADAPSVCSTCHRTLESRESLRTHRAQFHSGS